VYRLAEKRCANFGTCGLSGTATSGTAKVNVDLFPLFAEGARMLERGQCSAVRPIVNQIVSLMTVPLVQGSLRYAYKIGMVAADRSQKNAAEGAVFAASVLPLVNYCNPASAATIAANQKFGLFDAGTYPNFPAVKAAFEETYACLGITCAQVGGLVSSSGTLLDAATAPCTYAGSTYTFEVAAAGAISDFTASVQQTMIAAVARRLNVNNDQVTLSILSGSVRIVVNVRAADATQLADITASATGFLQTPFGATQLLGGSSVLTVESVTDAGATVPGAPTTNTPDTVVTTTETSDSIPTWGIIALIVLGLVAVVLCLVVVTMYSKEKAGKPIFTTVNTPRAAA